MYLMSCLAFIPRALFFLMLAGASAHAAMQLDRTRLVVHEAEGSAVIQVRSEDTHTLLLQVWIDVDAPDHDSPQDRTAVDSTAPLAPPATPFITPFITDPPVLRLEPGETRAIQVLLVHAPDTLPADRESLYWLNVLEVPAEDVSDTGNRLSTSVQSRLKLFYRPQALAQHTLADLEPDSQLHFSREQDATGQMWLTLHNPALLYQSLATLTLRLPDDTTVALDTPMLAPFATQRLALPPTNTSSTMRVQVDTLSEDGNLIHREQVL